MQEQQPKPGLLKGLVDRAMGGLGFVAKGEKKAIALADPRTFFTAPTAADPNSGVRKPGTITFDQLRKIARFDALIRICVNVIKKEVSQSEWDIIPRKKFKDNFNPEHILQAEALFTLVNKNGENLRVLLDRIIEDLLILDAAVIEKVFNAKGELMELNSVDGATIRPVYDKYGNLNPEKAYIQVINEKTVADFKINEMIYIMQNPQNDIRLFGYGLSPIESVLLAVQASLNADVYNAATFSKDNIPPGILDLGDMSDAEAKQFSTLWNATVINNTQKLKFVWGSNSTKKYIPFQNNNKDMQFVEYIDWLSRIKLSAYGLSTLDANITQDVNRSTAEVQEQITNSRGVRSVKKLIEEFFNREIIIPMGFEDVQFKFSEMANLKDQKLQAETDKIYIETGVILPSDVAKREGLETSGEKDIEEDVINDGGNSPNPADGEVPDDELNPDNQKSKKGTHYKPLY